ncbi:uncharacterized protein YPR053C [Saccharomyces cerevisiae S288C]|uniref:Uncharacterized protein YPR053C n=1 Tax=Saccharomyces cerevisiae (strain ATCC 204508 / S288c) TaxID=559292 RepID=YP053_YEAST|eukprot:NP_001335825.1 hypothetical protein YPR053C [Saccharomyces cerevisiae S288C]
MMYRTTLNTVQVSQISGAEFYPHASSRAILFESPAFCRLFFSPFVYLAVGKQTTQYLLLVPTVKEGLFWDVFFSCFCSIDYPIHSKAQSQWSPQENLRREPLERRRTQMPLRGLCPPTCFSLTKTEILFVLKIQISHLDKSARSWVRSGRL